MQAYAQIVDPRLTLANLPGPRPAAELPEGWRYRARRLRKRLVLNASGAATIIQDDLQNTYQLAKTKRGKAKRRLS